MLQGNTLDTLGKVFGMGGIGLAALWIVMRSRFWKNGQNNVPKAPVTEGSLPSGQLSVAEWEGKMRKIREEYDEELMKDMRQLFESRLSSVVATAIREALSPLPGEIAEVLRRVFREKGL